MSFLLKWYTTERKINNTESPLLHHTWIFYLDRCWGQTNSLIIWQSNFNFVINCHLSIYVAAFQYHLRKIHFWGVSLRYDMKLVAWLNSMVRYNKFDHAPTLCHIPMTLKNMNFISYIYISTLICVPFVDDTQKWNLFSKMN
jgi:hypothetical protein